MKGYFTLRKRALDILDNELSPELYYHGVDHTLDVLETVNRYIRREGLEQHDARLLRLGTLYHDIGFTVSNEDHEAHSARIARAHMEEMGCDEADIKVVEGLIAATRIPQSPKTHLEKIICDSDLDYLGRADFWPISDSLFRELHAYGKVNNKEEWNRIQIPFLEKHSYHTNYARRVRQPVKEQRIRELWEMVARNPD